MGQIPEPRRRWSSYCPTNRLYGLDQSGMCGDIQNSTGGVSWLEDTFKHRVQAARKVVAQEGT